MGTESGGASRGKPTVTSRSSRPLSQSEINQSIGSRGLSPSVTSRSSSPLSTNEARESRNRANNAGPLEGGQGQGGTPLFLTPNGLLIPSASDNQDTLGGESSTTDGQPDQTGTQPRRRAASLLTLGLADTTRKTLLGR